MRLLALRQLRLLLVVALRHLLRLLLVLLLQLLHAVRTGLLLGVLLVFLLLFLLQLLTLLLLLGIELFLLLLEFLVLLGVARVRGRQPGSGGKLLGMDGAAGVACGGFRARRVVVSGFFGLHHTRFRKGSRTGSGGDRRLAVVH